MKRTRVVTIDNCADCPYCEFDSKKWGRAYCNLTQKFLRFKDGNPAKGLTIPKFCTLKDVK